MHKISYVLQIYLNNGLINKDIKDNFKESASNKITLFTFGVYDTIVDGVLRKPPNLSAPRRLGVLQTRMRVEANGNRFERIAGACQSTLHVPFVCDVEYICIGERFSCMCVYVVYEYIDNPTPTHTIASKERWQSIPSPCFFFETSLVHDERLLPSCSFVKKAIRRKNEFGVL